MQPLEYGQFAPVEVPIPDQYIPVFLAYAALCAVVCAWYGRRHGDTIAGIAIGVVFGWVVLPIAAPIMLIRRKG